MTAPLPGPANASDPTYMAPLGGLAPTRRQIHNAKRNRNIAMMVWAIPLTLVLIGVYWRLAVGASPLNLGPVTWILPAAVVAIVAATLWALIVEPNSRGNALGDTHRAETALDASIVARDEELLSLGRQLQERGDLCAQSARAELLEAEERITDAVKVSHRSLQVAAGVLNVPNIPVLRSDNLMKPSMPHLDRIRDALDEEIATQHALVTRLGIEYLPRLEELPSPHLPLSEPADVPPTDEFLDPRGMPNFAGSTLAGVYEDSAGISDESQDPRRRRRLLITLLILTAVLAAAAWLVFGGSTLSSAAERGDTAITPVGTTAGATPAPAATSAAPTNTPGPLVPAHPSVPDGIREGVDYSYMHHGVDNQPARWSCNTPITVRVAGTAPPGAESTVAGAVTALRGASGLPLTMGSPLPTPLTDPAAVPTGEIVYSYLPPKQVTAAGVDLTGDVLGEGGPRYDPGTGHIVAGWVVIRSDGRADPGTPTGDHVAWHEGAHALGLGHSQQTDTEIMAPATDGTQTLAWGPGDTYALQSLGCTT